MAYMWTISALIILGVWHRCTVKSPSQSAMDTLITKCKTAKKPLVVAGCVPQGSRDLKELEGVSIVGVQQIDRVVEVVEETLKGHEVRLLHRKTLPALDLPKVSYNLYCNVSFQFRLGGHFRNYFHWALVILNYHLLHQCILIACNNNIYWWGCSFSLKIVIIWFSNRWERTSMWRLFQ